MQKWIILGTVILIVIIGIVIVINVDVETEYIPESEIEEVELRKTIVSLYFREKETGEIVKETRLIDSKELLKNPYEKLINMLQEGPQNSNFESVLPENLSIIETKYESGCVTINFNSEFSNIDDKNKVIEAIEKTLKELTEVTKVKILIDGNEFENLEDNKKVESETQNIVTENTNVQNVTTSENVNSQNTETSESSNKNAVISE